MPYNCCSVNYSSRSTGGYLRSSNGSSHPSNLVYSAGFCSPSTCQLGSSLYRGCRENCCEPTCCQSSCVVWNPYKTSCYRLKNLGFYSPCQATYTGSLGYGSRSCYSLGCGTNCFRSLGHGASSFPSLSYGCGLCHPTYFPSRSFYSPRPFWRSGFCY
ncbi:keratin-associated protein 13-2 [Tupaia chinensis]|uniref:Keratin-associated protein n=1 Tax=Tupaia chinensis TaxID=246437 RepID=L9KA85_TUPCH|nr:keratin-associated protein 13-2 [Tupaia chinensis]ELW59439.1 Keratin-associated protein 13-2 [Tupaia chinensis]